MEEEQEYHGQERRFGEQRSALERHAQTVILAIIVGLMSWVGVSITQTRETMVRLEERVGALSTLVDELRRSANGAYTRAEADRDFGRITGRVDDIERRLRNVEGVGRR